MLYRHEANSRVPSLRPKSPCVRLTTTRTNTINLRSNDISHLLQYTRALETRAIVSHSSGLQELESGIILASTTGQISDRPTEEQVTYKHKIVAAQSLVGDEFPSSSTLLTDSVLD